MIIEYLSHLAGSLLGYPSARLYRTMEIVLPAEKAENKLTAQATSTSPSKDAASLNPKDNLSKPSASSNQVPLRIEGKSSTPPTKPPDLNRAASDRSSPSAGSFESNKPAERPAPAVAPRTGSNKPNVPGGKINTTGSGGNQPGAPSVKADREPFEGSGPKPAIGAKPRAIQEAEKKRKALESQATEKENKEREQKEKDKGKENTKNGDGSFDPLKNLLDPEKQEKEIDKNKKEFGDLIDQENNEAFAAFVASNADKYESLLNGGSDKNDVFDIAANDFNNRKEKFDDEFMTAEFIDDLFNLTDEELAQFEDWDIKDSIDMLNSLDTWKAPALQEEYVNSEEYEDFDYSVFDDGYVHEYETELADLYDILPILTDEEMNHFEENKDHYLSLLYSNRSDEVLDKIIDEAEHGFYGEDDYYDYGSDFTQSLLDWDQDELETLQEKQESEGFSYDFDTWSAGGEQDSSDEDDLSEAEMQEDETADEYYDRMLAYYTTPDYLEALTQHDENWEDNWDEWTFDDYSDDSGYDDSDYDEGLWDDLLSEDSDWEY